MAVDPTSLIGEVLGRPAVSGYHPASDDYICPFTTNRCIKARSAKPMPVCSVWRGGKLIIVCPNRFRQRNLVHDVLDNCWPGEPPADLSIAPEVQMTGVGNVDFVLAEILDGAVARFISVEAQAVDITGSYRPAYDALVSGSMLSKTPTFNINWDNVYKRYITQVIRKGFYHHHWGSKIVALMQVDLYQYIQKFPFLTTKDVDDQAVNVVFLLYRYDADLNLIVDDIVGTSHANLSQAALYAKAPDRAEFEKRVLRSIGRHHVNDLDDLPDLGTEEDLWVED